MRTRLMLTLSTVLFCAAVMHANASGTANGTSGDNAVRLMTSPDLENIARVWLEAYSKTGPGTDLTLEEIPDNRLNEVIRKEGTIALVSQKDLSGLDPEESWLMVVGRDVIVPVMNLNNPYRAQLMKQGISPEAFARIYTSPGVTKWNSIIGNGADEPVKAYAFGSKTCLSYLAAFMDTNPERITAQAVGSKEEMLERIRNNRYAIGFCRLSEMAKAEQQGPACDLCLIPVDLNGNRKIDKFEHIYECTGDLSRGIWIGKYPRDLYNKLYAVVGDEPGNESQVAFLEWLITDGQQYLAASDYSQLIPSERISNIERMEAPSVTPVGVPVGNRPANIILVVIGILLAGILFFFLGIRFASRKRGKTAAKKETPSYINGADDVTIDGGLFFDKTHTWAFMEKNGRVRVGIDDFLQHITGRITRVELKKTGEEVKKGDSFVTLVQEGKKLEIQSPVSGTIKAHNPEVELNPDLLNDSPCCEGWIYEVEPSSWLQETSAFLMGDHYREWIRTEFARLKEFLSSGLRSPEVPAEEPVVQDSGAVRDGVMEYYGPEAWEDFQSRFMNRSGT